jgi:hypothetical protein
MNRRFGFGLIWLLLTLAVVGIVAAVAYDAGLAARVVSVAPGGDVPAAPYYYRPDGWGFFGIFPLLFFIFILFLLLRPRRHWYGGGWYRHWGHGPWGYPGQPGQPGGPQDVPPMFEPMLKSWHARAHGEAPPQDPGTPPTPTA